MPATDESDSGFWPTATAGDAANAANDTAGRTEESRERNHSGETLVDAVKLWQTPQTPAGGGKIRGGGRGDEALLPGQAELWATPSASVANDGEGPETFLARAEELKAKGINGNGAGMPLTVQSGLWATPTSHERTHTPRPVDHGEQLANQVDLWMTPAATNHKGSSGPGDSRGQLSEQTEATGAMWMTPTARVTPDCPAERASSSPALESQATQSLTPLPDPATGTPGSESLPCDPTLRRQLPRLNPSFVEWLQMWPIGWTELTSLELTVFEHWATASCQRVRQLLC